MIRNAKKTKVKFLSKVICDRITKQKNTLQTRIKS